MFQTTASAPTAATLREERRVDVGLGFAGLAGDRDVRGREQEDLARDALDLAVEAQRETAREVDEAARVGIAHLREVDDDRDALAEGLGDHLGVAVLHAGAR